jgi:dTDP-4-dehydrorhamnose 3,5-epimerase-like enzyme
MAADRSLPDTSVATLTVMTTTIDDCRLLEFNTVQDTRGNLSIVEGGSDIPFTIARAYWLYDVPGGESRGGHAHKKLWQLIVSASGSFEVMLDDGRDQKKVLLNRSYYGLLIPSMIWRELTRFSSGSVCLVLASEQFDESDYYRDHSAFVADKTCVGRG